MSACGRAQDLLNDWRDGKDREHTHGWGEECLRCTADLDAWEVIGQLIETLTPIYVTPTNGPLAEPVVIEGEDPREGLPTKPEMQVRARRS